ncbi:20203_t:CDS:2 [Funneliformis geosporum]|nr:20203_t:CDS:2 [Funneliformis geosporum]
MSEFYKNLSIDFSALLDHSDDYNVVIRVGEEEKAFQAHSVILRARSPYFKTALSSDWARKEGGSIVFTKPNVTPTVFEIILRYMYSGDIDLNSKDTSDILDLLIASDELLLQELFNHVQAYLLTYKKEWIKKNVVKEDIMKFYLKSDSGKPQNRLSKPRLISFDSTLIKQEHVARLCDWIDRKDGKAYTFENIPYKFRLLIRGTKDGFESETFHEKCDHKGPTIVVMQIAYSGELVGGYNPIEWSTGDSRITTQNSFLFSFPKQGNIADAKISRVNRAGYAIRVKDKTHGPCFGDKDLWMKHNFNAYDSCSSDKDDYQDRVTNLSKFWVIEYEVFQVIKK